MKFFSKTSSAWKYFFELIVVFLGVTAAFMLDQWGESRNERKKENKYLSNIMNELEMDSRKLRIVLDFNNNKKVELEGLIENDLRRGRKVACRILLRITQRKFNKLIESYQAGGVIPERTLFKLMIFIFIIEKVAKNPGISQICNEIYTLIFELTENLPSNFMV